MPVERGLGSGSYPGNSSSLLPAAHCTSAFPSTKASSQSWAGAQGWSKITCMAQSLCQAICQPHTDFLFSSPHPSLSALSWQGWHTAHQHRGTLEMQLSEPGGKQGALVLRTAVPTGVARHRSPQAQGQV